MSFGVRGSRSRLVFGIGVLLGSLPVIAATNTPPFQPKFPDPSFWPQGRYVYERNCLVCHGRFGDGRGEMGKELKPPPRNFDRGIFKYRSTPAGSLPTDEDLERTIRGGLIDTSMPMFQHLSDRELKSVIEYVKSFSARWRHATNYAPALRLPTAPDWLRDPSLIKTRAEKGRFAFNTACAACHGANGDGRGSAASSLEDAWGQPTNAADLRKPRLRSGPELSTIYRVLLTGIDGAPMPSFAEAFTEEQRWDLVAFIAQLRREHTGEE